MCERGCGVGKENKHIHAFASSYLSLHMLPFPLIHKLCLLYKKKCWEKTRLFLLGEWHKGRWGDRCEGWRLQHSEWSAALQCQLSLLQCTLSHQHETCQYPFCAYCIVIININIIITIITDATYRDCYSSLEVLLVRAFLCYRLVYNYWHNRFWRHDT